jgi:hypothetical protein
MKAVITKWLFKGDLQVYLLEDGRLAFPRAGAVSFFGGKGEDLEPLRKRLPARYAHLQNDGERELTITTDNGRRVVAVDMMSFGLLCSALVDAFVNDDLQGDDARQIARAAWRFVSEDCASAEDEAAVLPN